MAVFWWAGSLIARQLAESFVYARLEADAASVRSAWLATPAANFDRIAPTGIRLYPEYERLASGRYFVIRFEDGREIRSRSAWEQTFAVPLLAPGEQLRRQVTGVAGEPLQIWFGGARENGVSATVSVAMDVSSIRHRLAAVQWYFLAISVLLLAALLGVQHLIVRRSVARLDAIRSDIERLGHGEITALAEDVPEEVRPLVVEFNRLLTRFDQRLRQSRNAVGNLAHALKGPLNLLVRAADERHATDPVSQNAERIRQLIDSELRRARLVGRTSAGKRFDLGTEVAAMAGLLAQVYAEKSVEVRLAVGADVEIVHDREDMLELLGNLLDNAVKWANSLVMVNARSADGLLLEVEDDGPGVSDNELALLTERGVRLDESVAGHGLGLAIVRDIVASYSGELELGRSNRLGGFRVSLRLPVNGPPGVRASSARRQVPH